MLKKASNWLWWPGKGKGENLDTPQTPQSPDLTGSFSAEDAAAQENRENSATRSPQTQVHFFFGLGCHQNAVLPADAEEVALIQAHLIRRFCFEFCECEAGTEQEVYTEAHELPNLVLTVTSIADPIAIADALQAKLLQLKRRPKALVCYFNSPTMVANHNSCDNYVSFTDRISRELVTRNSEKWASGSGVTVTFLSGIGTPSSSPLSPGQRMTSSTAVSGDYSDPEDEEFIDAEDARRRQGLSLEDYHLRVDVDEAYRKAVVLIGTDSDLVSDVPASDARHFRMTVSSLDIYEEVRRRYLAFSRSLARATQRATGATQLDMDSMVPVSASQKNGVEDEELIDVAVSSTISHMIQALPTATVKTILAVAKNLNGENFQKYLVLNHTSDRFRDLCGQYPAAMRCFSFFGFSNASNAAGQPTLALPVELADSYKPEIQRAVIALEREIDARRKPTSPKVSPAK